MPSGEMLIKLFENFKSQNEEGFIKIAYEIIEEEKQKNHYVLANKLKSILFSNNFNNGNSSSAQYFNSLKDLPKDKDKGLNLVDIRYSEKTFDDILLSEQINTKLQGVVEEYSKKDILCTYNLSPKTKLLFCGPPGCGKTLCAEILASSLGLPILYVRFDSLISSYLGETATNIRNVFDYASKGNWVLFLDEFDAVGKSRDNVDEHGELKRVVNTFLQLLDSFGTQSFVIAATNHEKLIDNALWRRFDEVIYFDMPSEDSILQYVELKLRCFKHKKTKIKTHIKDLVGLSYADIERVCLEAIKRCVLDGLDELDDATFAKKIQDEKQRMNLIKKIIEC
ncbi:MAG: AAA family ATPase [Bacillota bacterium]